MVDYYMRQAPAGGGASRRALPGEKAKVYLFFRRDSVNRSRSAPIAVTEGHIDGALAAPQIEGFAGADWELYAHIGVLSASYNPFQDACQLPGPG